MWILWWVGCDQWGDKCVIEYGYRDIKISRYKYM